MKKVLFVVAFCVAVSFANAQDQNATPATAKPTTGKSVQRPNAIKEADLMQPIKDDLKKQFDGYTFQKAFKNERVSGITYDVILKKDDSLWKAVYSKDGKFIKKEEMPKQDVKK